MMQKYGVEKATEHFMSFNTICDATQVSPFSLNLVFVLWKWHFGTDVGCGQLDVLDRLPILAPTVCNCCNNFLSITFSYHYFSC
jgi:hypothetical protein